MEEIKKRDFVRKISNYLKEGGEYAVVGSGGTMVVTIRKADNISASKPKAVVKPVKRLEIEPVGGCETECAEVIVEERMVQDDKDVMGSDAYYADKAFRMSHYGCGCERVPGVMLCGKHGRA